ncbi:MAG: response regulator [Polyangiaceae bacterium]|nr:response regulator [Polyangiaceae bacterium]
MLEPRRVRVLIVEDDRASAARMQAMLEEFGYEVLAIADTAGTAISVAASQSPDIVLMDILIDGELDGIDAAQVLRSRFDVPVVFVTARTDPSALERVKRARPWAYVLKPVQADALHWAITIALERQRDYRAIHDSERWSSTTVKLLDDGVISTDRQLRVLYMNPSAQAMLGGIIGRGDTITSVDVLAMLREPLERTLAFAEVIDVTEPTVLGARTVFSRAAPVFDHAGRVRGAVVILRRTADDADQDTTLPPTDEGRISAVDPGETSELEASIITLDGSAKVSAS